MNIIRQEIRTGLLVVVSLAILVTITLYLGSPGFFVPQKTFYIYLDNANGLKQGAEVALAGRRIGQVIKLNSPVPEAERPDPKKETKVEVRVNKSTPIYNRVHVALAQNGLLGEYFIDFTSGQESSGWAADKASFLGEKPPGLDQVVPIVLERLDPALKKATETFDSLSRTADNLTTLTQPGKGEIPLLLAEFRGVGTNLKELTDKEGSFHQALTNVATLTSQSGELAKALQNAEKFTADLATNPDLRITLENSRKASADLDTTLTELRFKFGSIADNLNEASDTVKRQPWRLIWPATKKYPERAEATAAVGTPAARARRR